MVGKDEKKGSKDSKKQKKSRADEEEAPKQGLSKTSTGLSKKPEKPSPEKQKTSPLKKIFGSRGKAAATPTSGQGQPSKAQSSSDVGKKNVVEKGREQQGSSKRSSESDIKVTLEPEYEDNPELEPEEWLQYNVPFYMSGACMVKWKGSEEYSVEELNDWPMPLQGYLGRLIPPKRPKKGDLTGKPLTLILNFSEVVQADFEDQVCEDVRNVFKDLLWITEFCKLEVDLIFDTARNKALEDETAQDLAANMVKVMILECQDNARRAKEIGRETRRRQRQGTRHRREAHAAAGEEDDTITRDFAEPSNTVRRRKPPQMTMFEDSPEELAWKFQEKDLYERTKAKPTPYTGDERDMEIQPDPKRPT